MIFLKNGPQKTITKFQNRQQAGLILSQELKQLDLENNLLICAIPRGGVVVGAEIAAAFKVPLTALPVKKIPAPGNSELAIGAVGPWGKPIFDDELISALQISQDLLKPEVKKARDEVNRRVREYQLKKPNFRGKTVVITDDGIATGATIMLAAKLVRSLSPKSLTLAVPVAPKSTVENLKSQFDKVVVLLQPEDFRAVGQFYYDFPEVKDSQVRNLLKSTAVKS